jgi:hypothetical protein
LFERKAAYTLRFDRVKFRKRLSSQSACGGQRIAARRHALPQYDVELDGDVITAESAKPEGQRRLRALSELNKG